MLRYIFQVAILLVAPYSILSQTRQVRFESISSSSELSEANVLSIYQGRKGFMWFGTSDGLFKYNGYEFTVYKHDPKDPHSISNDFIQVISGTGNDVIWFGTLGGGFCQYDRKNDRFIRYLNQPDNPNSLANNDVTSILEDSKGNLWIGTMDGLDKLQLSSGKFTHYRTGNATGTTISDNHITNVTEDNKGNIWVATLNGGLNKFNAGNHHLTIYRHSPNDRNSINSNNIHSTFQDSRGNIWVATKENGVDKLEPSTNTVQHIGRADGLTSNAIRTIEEDSYGRLWFGSENGGLSILHPATNEFISYTSDEFNPNSLPSNSINSIYKDVKGNVWVGSFNAGVSMVSIDADNIEQHRHIAGRNSLSNNKVLCFLEDTGKNIWIGTDGGGLNKFDPSTGKFTHYRHNPNNKNSIAGDYVLSLMEDKQGNIWIGTWADGITVFNPAKNSYHHYKNIPGDSTSLSNNNAWYVYQDKQENIWIGTYGGGLNRFNKVNNSFTSYRYLAGNGSTISDDWINTVFQDRHGTIWVGTVGGGLNKFINATGTFQPYQPSADEKSISHAAVFSIYEDSKGRMWVGTQAGLNLFSREKNEFRHFQTEQGLPGNFVYGIEADDKGNLWLGTNKGISRFNPGNQTFRNIGKADGLLSDKGNEKALLLSSSGEIYFGGNNGFNRFEAEKIHSISYDPPVVLTDFSIFNRKVPIASKEKDSPLKENITVAKSITISYRNNYFSFSFASLNYTNPEKKKYAYMLEGFDEVWNEVGTRRSATYTNLDPGTYLFKVKGLNNDGSWSEQVRSIQLIITPPFWMTWWFRIAVVLFFVGGIVGFYFVRINAVKKQRRILEKKVAEQTAALKVLHEEERKARREADEANQELERKNKELEQFVYIASHDLQEPLRTTNSFVDLFTRQYKGKLDEKAEQVLSFITGATERMRRLINDLLDYSRLGTDVEMKKIDCNKVVEEIKIDLDVAIKESGANVMVAELPVIEGYPTAIKQLFQNLITNGIKFRKKGVKPEIKIWSDEEKEYWKFYVSDNGIGIDPKHGEKIFAIFQRLHARKDYEGSGIGLAHCKKIVEMHKGTIRVESTVGEGSRFVFTIRKASVNL